MSELKKEFKNYLNDLEKNIKNKEDLEYVKERTSEFINIVIDQMEIILNYKEDKISQIEKIQTELQQKIHIIQQEISEIEEEIYMEEEEYEQIDDSNDYDLEIVCPYCDNDIYIYIDQNMNEIECPECNNIIELDWTGDVEETLDNGNGGCHSGNCSGCHGCGIDSEEDDM